MLEREAAVLFDFLESRWGGTHTTLQIAKETFICLVYAFGDILDRLAAKHVPKLVPWKPLQLSDVLLQLVHVQAFAVAAIVPPMQCNAMVIDDPSDVYA